MAENQVGRTSRKEEKPSKDLRITSLLFSSEPVKVVPHCSPLKMLGVDTLVVDSADSVGSNWRKRYKQLVLQDPVYYDHLPYINVPASWRVYTPKDKLAGFFESYVKLLELNVWTKTVLKSSSWDERARRWNVGLEKTIDGTIETRIFYQDTFSRPGSLGQGEFSTKKGPVKFQGRTKFLYELQGNSYLNTDVITNVSIRNERSGNPNRVLVIGAKGSPPPPSTKAIIPAIGGYVAEAQFYLNGLEIDAKEQFMRQQLNYAFSKFAIDRYGTSARNTQNQAEGKVMVRVVAQAHKKEE
ncbi:hypothetical protein LTR41_010946 [Exophiala xenobiotica]|nr:hypothetical protein LTR41_010946 [Exophiala xenobiotica]KAK5551114.1 hypothetical protein LTR46_010867 [Exophiala xenobiotica]